MAKTNRGASQASSRKVNGTTGTSTLDAASDKILSASIASQVALRAGLISDPKRVQILMLVSEGGWNVGSIAKAMGMSQPAVSHSLMLFRMSGAFEAKRDGKANFYELTEDGRKLLAAAEVLGLAGA